MTTSTRDPDRDALDVRPTADEMLARVKAEEASTRGRLRVYLGMAPGVGKTWKMLEEGHRRKARGTDVVVGFVETHGRSVVAELVDGLEVVPRRRIDYRGVVIEEMDTDAIIARGPTVALVDELAHTNVPGSVRPKRYEDVEAIRDAGIHVVSTMNVQHLESVADAVATITGAPVNERVPDAVLLNADEIELVDMSPHALRQRMKHGNVYPPERTRVALEQFFTESNLVALRELALRYVARKVEGDLDGVPSGKRLPLISERVAVLVDGSPASLRAVRRAAALAGALHGAFLALVIETPASERQTFDRSRDLQETIDDAVDLGAEVIRAEASDLVTGLERISRDRRITQLVLPHGGSGGAFRRLTQRPLADEVFARLPEIEIHLVGAKRPDEHGEPPRAS
ncbi:MAG TPA: sensor histidine kinase KdpD [Candidatus Limnocylindrales bacterium]|nr:sensor histidine kinase KdpD [Candidatus Limnocylindrales bacterium]